MLPTAISSVPAQQTLPGEVERDVIKNELAKYRDLIVDYLLTYIPRGVEKGGWHPIDARLKNARGKVTARRGYLR
jgi:hypothetical protein